MSKSRGKSNVLLERKKKKPILGPLFFIFLFLQYDIILIVKWQLGMFSFLHILITVVHLDVLALFIIIF